MWGDEILLILLVVGGVLFLFGRGLQRLGWFGGTKHKVSSGAASFLGELDHMLNPQRPTIEDIRAAKEDDDDRGFQTELVEATRQGVLTALAGDLNGAGNADLLFPINNSSTTNPDTSELFVNGGDVM